MMRIVSSVPWHQNCAVVEEDGCLSEDMTVGGSDYVFHMESYMAHQSVRIFSPMLS